MIAQCVATFVKKLTSKIVCQKFVVWTDKELLQNKINEDKDF